MASGDWYEEASQACRWWWNGIEGTPRLFCAKSAEAIEKKEHELAFFAKNAKEGAENRNEESSPPPGAFV